MNGMLCCHKKGEKLKYCLAVANFSQLGLALGLLCVGWLAGCGWGMRIYGMMLWASEREKYIIN